MGVKNLLLVEENGSHYGSRVHVPWLSEVRHRRFCESSHDMHQSHFYFAHALVACSFIAMVLTCFVEFGRPEWHMMVGALSLSLSVSLPLSLSVCLSLSLFKGETEFLEGARGFSTGGRDVKG